MFCNHKNFEDKAKKKKFKIVLTSTLKRQQIPHKSTNVLIPSKIDKKETFQECKNSIKDLGFRQLNEYIFLSVCSLRAQNPYTLRFYREHGFATMLCIKCHFFSIKGWCVISSITMALGTLVLEHNEFTIRDFFSNCTQGSCLMALTQKHVRRPSPNGQTLIDSQAFFYC